jgi:hypothetical protein
MKWFSSAMLGVLAAYNLGFGLALAGICQSNFWPAAKKCKADHGMSKISHTEPSQHCNITHWAHVKTMKGFSSAMLGVLAAYILGFGLASLAAATGWTMPNFWPAARKCKADHGMSKISHTEPSQHCNITHWTHVQEMKWFSSAMLDVRAAANNQGNDYGDKRTGFAKNNLCLKGFQS